MKKSALALILAVLMAVGLLTIGAAAADQVAKIGENTYDSLTAAISNAVNDDVITLLKDYDATNEGTITFDSGKKVTLNLGNNTLTIERFNLTHGWLTVENGNVHCDDQAFNVYAAPDAQAELYTKLVIKKDVKINADYGICLFPGRGKAGYSSSIEVYGNIDTGGIFVSGNLGNDADAAEAMVASGKIPTVTIYDGAVVNSGEGQGIAMNGLANVTVYGGAIKGREAIGVKRGTLTVNGGVFTSNGKYVNPAEANYNGTEATGATISITSTYNYAGSISVELKDGIFESTYAPAVYVGHSKKTTSGETVTSSNVFSGGISLNVAGGTFSSPNGVATVYVAAREDGDAEGYTQKVVTGGNFSSDVSTYVHDGMQQDEKGDVVISDTAVASVNGVGYTSLESAIEAAPAGATVELRKDVQMTSKVVINKNLTIDGNDKTITGAADNAGVNFEVTNGTVTFKNAVVTGFGKNAATNNDITVFLVTGDSTVFNAEYLTVNEFCRAAFAIEGGKFNIDNCDVDCSNTAEKHLTKAVSVKAGASKVEGSITNTKISGANSTYANWSTAGIEIFTNASVKVENCQLNNCDYGIWVDNYYKANDAAASTSVDVTITDTDVQSEYDAVLIFGDYFEGNKNSARIDINGGTYEGNGAVSLWNAKTIEDSGLNSITIKDGTFIGAVAAYSADENFEPVESTEDNSLVVKGGSFDSSVTDYLADNLKYQLQSSDGMFSYYESLDDALGAAAGDNGAVITYVGGETDVQSYTVTIVYGNGAKDFVQTLPESSYNLPTAPSKPGYIFLGWRCGDVTYGAGDTYTLSDNMTFYAVWANMPDVTPGTPDDGDDEPVVTFPFNDVSVLDWFYDAVYYVWENELMNGTDVNQFSPNSPLTRAMVWAVLARVDGETISGDSWMTEAQAWAVESGVSDGTDPTGYITREQLVTMLYRFAGEPAGAADISGHPDAASISDWAADAMAWAVKVGLIEGDDVGALNPTANSTRAHAATFFMRFSEL